MREQQSYSGMLTDACRMIAEHSGMAGGRRSLGNFDLLIVSPGLETDGVFTVREPARVPDPAQAMCRE